MINTDKYSTIAPADWTLYSPTQQESANIASGKSKLFDLNHCLMTIATSTALGMTPIATQGITCLGDWGDINNRIKANKIEFVTRKRDKRETGIFDVWDNRNIDFATIPDTNVIGLNYLYEKINIISAAELKLFSKKSLINNENIDYIKKTFNKITGNLRTSEFPLSTLFVSCTNSNSLYFRFSTDKKEYEFILDAFYDYNSEDIDDIEATLHIYKSGTKLSAHYGSIDYLFSLVEKILSINSASYAFINS